MNSMTDDGPTASDLAAIETEWPRIAADLAVLDAEITALYAADHVDELHIRRTRRATRRVLRTMTASGEAA